MLNGDILMVVGAYCIGPSRLLHLPNLKELLLVGLAFGGMGRGLISGFSTADAMKGACEAFPQSRKEATDIVASLQVVVGGVQSLSTPILASESNELVGFEWTMDGMATLLLLTCIIFAWSSLLDMCRERETARLKLDRPLLAPG